MTAPTATGAWQALARSDPDPSKALVGDAAAVAAAGLRYDHARERLDAGTLDTLYTLAAETGFDDRRKRLFAGEAVNESEGRAALHMALRARPGDSWVTGGEPVTDMVLAERERCFAYAEAIRDGSRVGADGDRFTDLVNIGIGGSRLGPEMVVDALGTGGPNVHFVSNADARELRRVLAGCRPRSTLFIVVSKSFTTQETLLNAVAARGWLVDAIGADGVGAHFAAVTAHPDRAADFGIPGRQVFSLWDWVGGRYSLWSAVGLAAMVALGRERFGALLDGARAMDLHFRDADAASNLPLRAALVGIHNRNFRGATTRAVLPYSDALRRLPAFLQQLEMESLGKRVDRAGAVVAYATGPAVWGMVGTDGQHTFHQWLHQGTDPVAVEFIGIGNGDRVVNANLVAQADALAGGEATGEPARDCPGRRPSSILRLESMEAGTVGALLAFYEHRVFAQSVVWNINPFDQWGVELGKKLAKPLIEADDPPI